MKEYVTTQPVELHTGRIGLNKKQAACRAPYLAQESPGVYTITGTVQFKAGEVICLDPDKATLAKLELTPAGKAKALAEKRQAEIEKAAAADAADFEKEKAGKAGKGKAE